ncbi:hypothetical protein ACFLYH_02820 [Candidatus Dependentiae bacterium]
MKKLKILLFLGWISFLGLNAAQQINQEAGTANFGENISVKAYDRYTGDFYVGTDAENGAYSVAKAGRGDSVFTGLSTEDQLQDTISYMALASRTEFGATHVALHVGGNNIDILRVLDLSDLTNILQAPANQIIDAVGTEVYFYNLAGGYYNDHGIIFLRVGNNREDSGILAFQVDDALTQRTGVNNFAVRLDDQKGAVAGDGNFFREQSTAVLYLNTNPVVNDMYWDDELQTLFTAGSIETDKENQIVIGISKVKFNGDNIIISDVIPYNVNPANNVNNCIFVAQAGDGDNDDDNARVKHVDIYKIRTMKTSTNKHYLIVNGGANIQENEFNSTNQIRALRYDPTAAATIAGGGTGQIVANDANGTTLVNPLVLDGAYGLEGGNANSLVVGGENAPWRGVDEGEQSADMQIVGDTVYVSFNGLPRNGNFDPGVWSSTAMFDDNGVIIGWTKWERVFPSANNSANHEDEAKFFAVDAKINTVWQVNDDGGGDQPKIVRRTEIKTTDFSANSLQTQLNRDLSDGCSCMLDLPKGTPGIEGAANGDNSFVLFGGIEKVSFARTKYGNANDVTTNFTSPNNYKLENLPAGAGVVRAVGYSRNTEDETMGYFFAGTDTGLYVYTANAGYHVGFNGLTTLNAAPFDGTFSWQKMYGAADQIAGPVTAIESNGLYIFVVEQDVTTVGGITSKLHRFGIDEKVGDMVGTHAVVAQSGVGPIPANTIFTGMKLVTAVGAANNSQHLVISTNNGIFVSTAGADAVTTADWDQVEADSGYHSIYSPKRTPTTAGPRDGVNHKIWGVKLADDSKALDYYQNSAFDQFGFQGGNANATLQPAGGYTDGSAANPLTYLDRTTSFWSDGARRLYTRFNANEIAYSTLRSFPYYPEEWNMTEPYSFSELSDIPRIYWVESISALGIVLAGTDTGVISLVE